MSFYLELNPKVPDLYFESKAFSKAEREIHAITDRLGLPSAFEFFSFAAQNDLCPPEHRETETPWFDAQVGIDWLEAVVTRVRSNPSSVPNAERLLADFSECIDVLQRAKAAGAKWHFAMDI